MRSKLLLLIWGMLSVFQVYAWSEHPLLAYPALSGIEALRNADSIEVESLKSFLLAEEKNIEKLLKDYESWALANLTYYAPVPDSLLFVATGNAEDVLQRFFRAIRINPNSKMALYLHLLPGTTLKGQRMAPENLTTLSDIEFMSNTVYQRLQAGDRVSPFDVLITANDEPDYGLDLGLFIDNGTNYGAAYGFGEQPFGDAKLEYGSQAPFHMGFYHEAGLVFAFGSFLKRTMPEYRISLYKKLAELALSTQHQYWGYRFMGWGMHYLGDLSMPYHAAPLPGVSAGKMIWTNVKAMIGFPKSKDNAVQLVSNKHAALESFQWSVVHKAWTEGDMDNPLLQQLKNPLQMVAYSTGFPVEVAAKEAVERSKALNKIILATMPARLVDDPTYTVSDSDEVDRIVQLMEQEYGKDAVEQMTLALAEIMRSYSMHLQSYYYAVVTESEKTKG